MDWLRYQIWGTMPTVSGDDMRPGPLFIEVINGNTCTMIPTDAVMHIFFDSGYHEALARNRKESNENLAAQMGNLVPVGPDEDEPEYDTNAVLKMDDTRAYL